MKVIVAALLYGVFFILVEALTLKTKLNKEFSRKTVHILAGISVAFLPWVMTFHEIIYLGLIFIPVMLFSKRANLLSSIHAVKRNTYGEVFFPLAICLTALLFPEKFIYMYGLLIMALSDGFASVVGQQYGKRKYRLLSAHKSYVGSLTFFLTALAIGIVAIVVSGNSLLISLPFSLIMAAALTLVEGGLSFGLDNLILSPLAGGLMYIVLRTILK